MGNAVRNEDYYDQAYASRSLVKILIKLYLSYDQLSKTRRNLAALKNHLKSPESLSVLDYGFGHGTLLHRVPRIHKLSGCELSSVAIGNVRRLFRLFKREISVFSQDEFHSSSHKEKYDLICCSHVLEHVENDLELLNTFHSSLCDGGKLMLNVPINEVWKDPNHVREYCPESLRQQLQRADFAVESVIESDRWTAYILDVEHVSQSPLKPFMRALRLLLAPLPVSIVDRMEKVLPKQYRFQQMIFVARKL